MLRAMLVVKQNQNIFLFRLPRVNLDISVAQTEKTLHPAFYLGLFSAASALGIPLYCRKVTTYQTKLT